MRNLDICAMVDRLTTEQRSYLMARIRGRDTDLEILVRRKLWAKGLRFRLGRTMPLPGKPDLVFVGPRVAVFVDGCFWHGCPSHGHIPKSNTTYWQKKLMNNIARDKWTDSKLIHLGWLPVRLWEHEIKENVDDCVKRVTEALSLRRATRK